MRGIVEFFHDGIYGKTPPGHGFPNINGENWFWRFRNWLIVKLAGDSPVAVNLRIKDGMIQLDAGHWLVYSIDSVWSEGKK